MGLRNIHFRNFVIGVFVCLSISAFLIIAIFAAIKSNPIQLTENYKGAEITYSASHEWVLFPRDCIEVSWTVKDALSTTFYPVIRPGIYGGEGVRSIFFVRDYQPGISVSEDAIGGVTETISSTEPQTRTENACVDFASEPKLRVHFKDGTSKSYKLGLDVLLLRLEIWVLLFIGISLAFAVAILVKNHRFSILNISIWFSSALLSLYALAFFQQADFIAIYAFDALIFLALYLTIIFLSIYSILYPSQFHQRIRNLQPKTSFQIGVILFWLWALSFGYFDIHSMVKSEFFWLPFFLWVFMVGMGILWWKRPQRTHILTPLNAVKISLICAILFAGVSFARDILLIQNYSIKIGNDSPSYIVEAKTFLQNGSSIGLPKRIFPYLMMNFVTQSNVNPMPLIMLQCLIAAVAVGAMTYVISRKHLALGIGVGLLLSLNLSWGTYNRTLLSESGFISFHVLCFAILFWHIQRKAHLRYWELVLFGMLYGWTLLFRGTGLPLIAPILFIYGFVTRTWLKPIAVLIGFTLFLAIVATYNQWRYSEFGLIGPQNDTLASSLFSYHLFSPENGATSREIDAALRTCMGYLDYDDVPRFANHFIYGHYNNCLNPLKTQAEITGLTASALRELITKKPFSFARILIQEIGIGLQYPLTNEFYLWTYQQDIYTRINLICNKRISWCDQFLYSQYYSPNEALMFFNQLLTYPNQLYLAVNQISSQTPAASLFAFIMLCGFLYVMTDEKLLILACTGFILYQLGTVAIAHNFLPRYGLILGSFFSIISVVAIWYIFQQITQIRRWPKPHWIIVITLILVYLAWANNTIRTSFTAPLLARSGINILQKYGVNEIDFDVYRTLIADSIVAFSPQTRETDISTLRGLGVVYNPFDLPPFQQDRLRGWQFTRLPGYLKDMGATHLLLDENDWASLPPADQAILGDPIHYRLIGEWQNTDESRRLYAIVGDTRGSYPIYEGSQIVIFEQSDRALDIYRLDENRNGIFVVRIPYDAEISNGTRYTGEMGWSVQFENNLDSSYTFVIRDETSQIIDDGYTLNLP